MRALVPAAAAVTVLVLGAACSDGPGGESSPGPSSGGATSSAAGSPGGTDPTGPTGSPEPTVAPATGPRLSMPHARLRIPAGWYVGDQLVASHQDGQDPGSTSVLSLGETPALGSTADLTELRRNALNVARRVYPMTPRPRPDVEVDGVEMYHLEGRVQPLNWESEFGVIVDDHIIVLRFHLSPRIPLAQRHQLVDSVLATFEWR